MVESSSEIQKLKLWQVFAIFIHINKNPGILVRDLQYYLSEFIKSVYPTISETKYKTIIRDELECHCKLGKPTEELPYVFEKHDAKWFLTPKGEEWAKQHSDLIEVYAQYIEDQDKLKNSQPAVDPDTLKNNLQNEKNNKFNALKESIEKRIINNNLYLLGQLQINALEYSLLQEYLKFKIEQHIIPEKSDLLMITALVKIAQKNSKRWTDIWSTIDTNLAVKTKFIKQNKKQQTIITQHKIKKIFKNTISFYNDYKNTNLFIDKDDKNDTLCIANHCFIFSKNETNTKYFEILKRCYEKDKNFTIDKFRNELLKSRSIPENMKNVIKTEYNDVENLLIPQVEYIKTKDKNLCKQDFFVKKLSEYLEGTYDTEQYNLLLQTENQDRSKKPYFKLSDNYKLFLNIPAQDIKSKTNISVKTTSGKEFIRVEGIYLFNDAYEIPIARNDYKYIFDDIQVIIYNDTETPVYYNLSHQPYIFFERNGKEQNKLYSVSRNPAVLITKDNVNVEGDIIREEESGDGYNIFLISLQDRNKYIEIDNKIHYLKNMQKGDLELDVNTIPNLKCLSQDIMYSTTLPKVIIKKNTDMTRAEIFVTNLSSQKILDLSFSDAEEVLSADSDDGLYIFDLDKIITESAFCRTDTIYRIEYHNNNTNLSQKFLLIDNINIRFKEEVYLGNEDIIFSIDKPYKLTNTELLNKRTNTFTYCTTKDKHGNLKPVEFTLADNTFQISIPMAKISYKNENMQPLSTQGQNYICEHDIDNELKLELPKNLNLIEEPVLITKTKYYSNQTISFKNKGQYYSIKKDKLIENDDITTSYKKELKIQFETENQVYTQNVGILYNRPYTNININLNSDNNVEINSYYDEIDNYPELMLKIENDKEVLYDDEIFDQIIIPANKLADEDNLSVSIYTFIQGIRTELDFKQYQYTNCHDISNIRYLKIKSIYLSPHSQKCDLSYYIIMGIKKLNDDLYSGEVHYCSKAMTPKLICGINFKTEIQGKDYIIYPEEQCNLVYARIDMKWKLVAKDGVKSNIEKIICNQ